jgi:hypothetical protein
MTTIMHRRCLRYSFLHRFRAQRRQYQQCWSLGFFHSAPQPTIHVCPFRDIEALHKASHTSVDFAWLGAAASSAFFSWLLQQRDLFPIFISLRSASSLSSICTARLWLFSVLRQRDQSERLHPPSTIEIIILLLLRHISLHTTSYPQSLVYPISLLLGQRHHHDRATHLKHTLITTTFAFRFLLIRSLFVETSSHRITTTPHSIASSIYLTINQADNGLRGG